MVSRPPTPRSGPVGDLSVLAVNPPQAGELSLEGCGFEPYRQRVVCHVPDLSKSGFSCPRCKTIMDEVVRIAPLVSEPGLIGYECPACCYVTSVILPPGPESEAWSAPARGYRIKRSFRRARPIAQTRVQVPS